MAVVRHGQPARPKVEARGVFVGTNNTTTEATVIARVITRNLAYPAVTIKIKAA